MSEQNSQAAEQQPQFNIQRIYLKDLSLEQPNSPGIFLEQESPAMEIALDVSSEQIADGFFESTITVTITAKVGEKVAFLINASRLGSLKCARSPKTSSSYCSASLVRTFCIPICARMSPT